MKCTEVIERLSCFTDGECDQTEEAHIREHLVSCESCRRQARLLEVMQTRTAQALHETAKAPDLTREVLSRIPRMRRRVLPGRMWFPAAAAFVLLALGLGIFLRPSRIAHTPQLVSVPTKSRHASVPRCSSRSAKMPVSKETASSSTKTSRGPEAYIAQHACSLPKSNAGSRGDITYLPGSSITLSSVSSAKRPECNLAMHTSQSAVDSTIASPVERIPILITTSVQGQITDGTGKMIKLGDKLPVGTIIRVGKDGRASFFTIRGSEISLAANSELSIDSSSSMRIIHGRLYCNNRDKEIARIDTPAGHVKLLGTVVDTAVTGKNAVVNVFEGKVQLDHEDGTKLALGKITSDPNVPGANVESSTVSDKDTRLATKITYEAQRKTVSAILADLSKITDVKLRAGWNENDWQVRDRKMNIFAKDTPLSELMSSVARVMEFQWSVNRDVDPWTYRLFMDRKTLLDAEAQKARSDERIREKLAKRRQHLLEGFEHPDNSDYFRRSPGTGKVLWGLCKEIPSLAEAVATGQELNLSGSQLSPESKKTVIRMLQSLTNNSFPEDIDNTNIKINGSYSPRLLAFIRFSCGDQRVGFGFNEGDTSMDDLREMLPAEYADWKRVSEDPNTPPDVKSEMVSKMSEVDTALDREGFDPGEPLAKHPDDPDLLKKIKLKPKSSLLHDVQCALAQSGGFAVVSDCFGKVEAYGGTGKGKTEIKTLLDRITNPCLYNWEKHGSVIEFRDRHWSRKRSAQIPESWIEAWRQTFKQSGTLDIVALAQIAQLTQEQFNMNIKGDEVLSSTPASERESSLASLFTYEQDALRAYGMLTEHERRTLFAPSGLDIRGLSPDQRAVMEKPIARRNARFLLNPDAQITMSVKRVQKNQQLEYTFTAATTDAMDPIVWTLTTPKYEPPKDSQPEENSLEGAPSKPSKAPIGERR